ncbi:MAG: Gfo/Idh/MocA family oxidoreductase [Planctomycetota bacterium]|nr:Gfo/Idh/MocA family oxidoreductase [Planctomycetota bacterium]
MKCFKRAGNIKVGVVGYGGAFDMGKLHLAEMKKAGMTPVAVADTDPARLKVAAGDFPDIETYPSMAAMLKKSGVNLITLITPHNTHARLALKALRSGRHVVCEKPLAITTAECDAMIGEAKKNRLVISTYHNRHWDGCIMNALKYIRSGVIGDVYRIEAHMGAYGKPDNWWRSSKSISGGILYDWGVHLLEYSFQIIDADIVEVAGFAKKGFWAPKTRWKNDTVEDEGLLVVRFAGGPWMTLCITSLDSNPKPSQLEITGTKGTFTFDYFNWECITHKGRKTAITKGPHPTSEGWRFYQNLADHLTKGAKLVITPEWSRRPIHVLDLADKSAKQGKALKAKYK